MAITICVLMLEWYLAIIGLIAAILAAVFTMNNKKVSGFGMIQGGE